jgi:hypothetical protein
MSFHFKAVYLNDGFQVHATDNNSLTAAAVPPAYHTRKEAPRTDCAVKLQRRKQKNIDFSLTSYLVFRYITTTTTLGQNIQPDNRVPEEMFLLIMHLRVTSALAERQTIKLYSSAAIHSPAS